MTTTLWIFGGLTILSFIAAVFFIFEDDLGIAAPFFGVVCIISLAMWCVLALP